MDIDEDADTNPDTTTAYEYNDQGIRVSQSVNGSKTLYLIDANNHTGYAQVLEEIAAASGALLKSYLLGHDVLAQYDSTNGLLNLLSDGHGSTRQLVDAMGAPVSSGGAPQIYTYNAYGELLAFTGTPITSILYSGEFSDAASGLQYLRARYYNPANGRFLRLDDFAGIPDDPLSLHKYLYTTGDPILFGDPSGRFEGLVGALGSLSIGNTIQNIKIEADLAAFQSADSTTSGIGLQQQLLLFAGGTIFGAAVGPLLDLGSSLLVRIADDVGGFITRTSTELAQLVRSGQRANVFEELDILGRPQFARAIVTRESLGTGTEAISSIRPPGFLGDGAGHARGHLIARQLGGPGNERKNLITIFKTANNRVMRPFENQVRRAVEAGETVDYLVIPIYEGSDLIARGVTLLAKGDRGFELSVTVLNRL